MEGSENATGWFWFGGEAPNYQSLEASHAGAAGGCPDLIENPFG
jgi:hypothetical protein